MPIRISLLLIVSLLFLPSCQHSLGDLFGSKNDSSVEFNYGEGTSKVNVDMTMELLFPGKDGSQEVKLASFDIAYTAKKIDSGIAWNIVLDNLNVVGSQQSASPFYSVSFTSDLKGWNHANMVKKDTGVEASIEKMGDSVIRELKLPEGRFKIGDRSMEIMDETFAQEGFVVVFPEPDPLYVYNGIKEINGRQCHAFSYETDEMIVKQFGTEMPSSLDVALYYRADNMLPVHQDIVFTMNNTAARTTTILRASYREQSETPAAPQEDKAETAPLPQKTEAALDPQGDLRERLEATPLVLVGEPMEFRYVGRSAGTYRAKTILNMMDGEKISWSIPFFNYRLEVNYAESGERLDWKLEMSELTIGAEKIDKISVLPVSFSSDRFGRNIKDFVDKSSLDVITADDVEKDFAIPQGSYMSGEVCMPIKMANKTSQSEFVLPPGAGYVFEGVKEIDSMKVIVLSANVDNFVAKHKKTGLETPGRMHVTRYYAYDTMLPLWYDGWFELDRGEKGKVKTNVEFIRVD